MLRPMCEVDLHVFGKVMFSTLTYFTGPSGPCLELGRSAIVCVRAPGEVYDRLGDRS
jgi:hypothetical protein